MLQAIYVAGAMFMLPGGPAALPPQGPVASFYSQRIAPLCRDATAEKYPFYGSSLTDASPVDMQRVFGSGGAFDAFSQIQLRSLLDKRGPVWRWRAGSAAIRFDPAVPDEFAKAEYIRGLLTDGLPLQVGLVAQVRRSMRRS